MDILIDIYTYIHIHIVCGERDKMYFGKWYKLKKKKTAHRAPGPSSQRPQIQRSARPPRLEIVSTFSLKKPPGLHGVPVPAATAP